jgi:translation initiation factor 1
MGLFDGTPLERPIIPDDPAEEAANQAAHRLPPEKQTAKLSMEKRAKGKMVTVVRGLSHEHNDLEELLRQLKSHCGAGGTLKDDELEIQGDQREKVREKLQSLRYKVKG